MSKRESQSFFKYSDDDDNDDKHARHRLTGILVQSNTVVSGHTTVWGNYDVVVA